MARDPRQEAKEVAIAVQDALQSIADSVQDTLESALGNVTSVTQSTVKDIEKGFKDLAKVGTLLAKTEEEARMGALTRSKVDQVILERKAKLEALTRSVEIAERNVQDELAETLRLTEEYKKGNESVLPDLVAQKELFKEAADEAIRLQTSVKKVALTNEQIKKQLEEQLERSKNVSRATGMTGDILGGLEKVLSKLGLSGFSEEFAEGASAARKLADEITDGGEQTATFGQKLQIASRGFGVALDGVVQRLAGPMGMLLAITKLFDVIVGVSKQATELGKSMSLSAEQSLEFRKELSIAAQASGELTANTKSLAEAQGQLAKAFGAARGFTMEQLSDQTKLTRAVGMQVESAGKLQKLAALNNETADEAFQNIVKANTAFGNQTGIVFDNREILEDVANASAEFAANLDNNPTAIGKAVVEMRRFGLNLENAVSMSKSLLDFESSIEAELEAELLTGKELNFERARALALQGKFAESAAEVASQVGTLADFQNMNVIAQESLANAAGLTVEELANSLMIQENLAKLGGEEQKRVQEQINTLRAQGKVEEANALARAATSDEEAIAALERLDAQEQMNQAMEKMSVAMGDIFQSLEPIVSGFASMLEKIANSKGAMNALKVTAGALALTLGIMAVKAIAAASALTLGLASIAIVGGITAATIAMTSEENKVKGSIKDGVIGPDGDIISTDPADFILATKDPNGLANQVTAPEGEGNSSLMKDLINELKGLRGDVQKGGDVIIDGNVTGQMLALGAYTSKTS